MPVSLKGQTLGKLVPDVFLERGEDPVFVLFIQGRKADGRVGYHLVPEMLVKN